MDTINITLNKVITSRMKETLKKKGYNNVSEYIRDLLRRDLNLEESDRYPYDLEYLARLEKEAKRAVSSKKIRLLSSRTDLTK